MREELPFLARVHILSTYMCFFLSLFFFVPHRVSSFLFLASSCAERNEGVSGFISRRLFAPHDRFVREPLITARVAQEDECALDIPHLLLGIMQLGYSSFQLSQDGWVVGNIVREDDAVLGVDSFFFSLQIDFADTPV
jgi:hypothetical protein